jgi:hypothetical protein
MTTKFRGVDTFFQILAKSENKGGSEEEESVGFYFYSPSLNLTQQLVSWRVVIRTAASCYRLNEIFMCMLLQICSVEHYDGIIFAEHALGHSAGENITLMQ